ncbi:hypothetical protein HHI36_009522 [Cryptolaemus montrouzieri]|uniref:BROMI C-terminal Rab TBC-like domain-containing protein n=1 Tax=Cryptolaemus montrouzieri TaxID=559131 RepID=A0ABD2MFY6_9CUCU
MLKISVQSKSNTLDDYAGLLMVKILISNLDGLVFFQEIFNLKNDLCRAQTQIDTECENDLSSPTFLSKKCSILRKNILSYLDATGYPNKELNVLCDDIHLEEKEAERAVRILGKKNTPPCDFQKFLFKSRDAVHDRNWINQVRRHFQKYCQLDYKISLVFEILNQISKVLNKEIILRIWPESNRWLPKLNVEETIAISIVVKFGMQSQLLNLGYKHEENLGILLKQSRIFLNLPLEESDGFDWFIGICFLICSGNLEKCKTFIMNIANLPSASLIWYKFGKVHGSFWIENFMQHLDVLLAENTTIYTALKMISLSPTIIIRKLLTQCFLIYWISMKFVIL